MKIHVYGTGTFMLLAFAACNQPAERVSCTDEFRYGLLVYVQDSATGASIASGSTLLARDGAFRDALSFPGGRADLDPLPLHTAGERPGTYQITVTKPGYVSWTRNNVSVTAGVCHVNRTDITARLQPAQ